MAIDRETLTVILSTPALEVFDALQRSAESRDIHEDGTVWGSVYLDNARPAGMSPRSFAGILGRLQKAELYRRQDDRFFGFIRLA
jgi:hypothetical protein